MWAMHPSSSIFFFNLWLLKQPQGFYLFQSILLLTCLGDHRGQESSTTDIEHDRAVTCSKHKTYMGRGRWSPAYKIMKLYNLILLAIKPSQTCVSGE